MRMGAPIVNGGVGHHRKSALLQRHVETILSSGFNLIYAKFKCRFNFAHTPVRYCSHEDGKDIVVDIPPVSPGTALCQRVIIY